MPEKNEIRSIGETEALKRLMIVDLIAKGVRQKHIAVALGISEGTLSTMFPKGMLREVRSGKGSTDG